MENKKKSTKILARILGVFIALAAVAGSIFVVIDQTVGNGAYNREIKAKYKQATATLMKSMERTVYHYLDNAAITGLHFEEEMGDERILKVFYEGDETTQFEVVRRVRYADFSVANEDYNSLVEAEESNDILYYLDCLNELFANMSFVKNSERTSTITMELPEYNANSINIFNDIFNVNAVKTDDIVKQIGFMPYYIILTNKTIDEDAERTYYTYKIYGISYCSTNSENSSYVKPSERLIIGDYDKNHIKSFDRVITFESYTDETIILEDLRLSGDIYKIIDAVNNPYTVTDYFFEEANLFEYYFMMQDGNFKFKKPKTVS